MDAGLREYLSDAKAMLAKFEETVGWKPNESETDHKMGGCPYDIGHRMTLKSLESHTKRCKWKKLGYSNDEIKEIFEEEERTNAMKNPSAINSDAILSRIAPSIPPIRSDKHYKCLLTPEQRLAIYEAEVAECFANNNKTQPDKALYTDLESKAFEKLYQKENPDNLTELEMLQKMRDMKRRRQSYRAKNVHITKRSQTEIIRGVLAVHMEELTKLWNPETERNYEKSEEYYKDSKRYQDGSSTTDRRYDNSKSSHDTSRNSRKRSYNDRDARESYRFSGHKSRRPEKHFRERSLRDNRSREDSFTRSRPDEHHASKTHSPSKQRSPSPRKHTSRGIISHSKDSETSVSEIVTKIRSQGRLAEEYIPYQSFSEQQPRSGEQTGYGKNRTYNDEQIQNIPKNSSLRHSEESVSQHSLGLDEQQYHIEEQTQILNENMSEKFSWDFREHTPQQTKKTGYSDEERRSHKHRKKKKKEHSKKSKSKRRSRSKSRDYD